ncbi:hypothetical protein CA13_33160 [Planctomycetes bacterium CA13]|uniref:Right handed beta helix domain-containing protein n=1 Tax=Novipirellula herctigrandis TaxID=2527986 RepID=A0A5C5Z3A4_9BACT|nr:hypothetical protein CA13_33160 [Planctomycetes bacterium CA13]
MKKLFCTCALWIATSLFVFFPKANADEFYVSPDGSNDSIGSMEQPFASIQRAQTAVRKSRTEHPTEPVTVMIAPGRYTLDRTLVFTPEDSGASPDQPVTYRALPGGDVVLSGGVSINDWQQANGVPGLWKTRIRKPKSADNTNWRFNQLWVNGRRAIRARTPNDWEFFSLLGVAEEPVKTQPKRFRHTFATNPNTLKTLQALSQEELRDVQVLAFHKWDTTREFLEEILPDQTGFTTVGDNMKSWNPMTRDSLYFFENYLQALDAPGEWFLDRDGWLYYQCRDGEEMTSADVVAAKTERLIEVRGEFENGNHPVKHLRFEGLKLRHAEFRIPDEGIRSWQAAMNVDATAVQLDGCRDISFIDCALEHIGSTGFWFRKACHDCRVERTRVFDCGISAIRIGEEKLVPEPVRTGGITIDNCILQSGGRITPHAVGVWIGHSSDNAITHCDVADFFYTAISVGWRWGYDQSGAKRNKIEFNHLHHLGYRILSDMGGVYTLGPSEGTTVRHNVIHDVYSTRYGGWGLYPDEGSSNILYENNLVYNVRDGCFHQHYGRDNIVRNNVFAFSEEGQIAVTRAEPHQSFTFERNVVYFDQGTLLGHSGWRNGVKVQMNQNLYWRAGGKPFDFAGQELAQWRELGNDQNSIVANPHFVDPDNYDFRLSPDSPVKQIGFIEFDYSQAGVNGDQAWKELAASPVFPEPYVVPPPEAMNLSDHFDQDSPLSLLRIATLSDEDRDALIQLAAEPDGDGRCLKVQDAADLKAGFNPHFYWDPQYTHGVATMSFRIRLEPGADVRCEWRSKTNPYRTGPNLHFGGGVVNSKRRAKLVEIPTDQWIKVTVTAPLGKQDATWKAMFEFADGTQKVANDLPCDADWTDARWVGFSSQSADGVSYYIDDLVMRVRPNM